MWALLRCDTDVGMYRGCELRFVELIMYEVLFLSHMFVSSSFAGAVRSVVS